MSTLSRLCIWYEQQCVGEWYEDSGVRIETLDNPGWALKIDIKGTYLQEKIFEEVRVERTDRDWLVARRDGMVFEVFGGPLNLDEMIEVFLCWSSTK